MPYLVTQQVISKSEWDKGKKTILIEKATRIINNRSKYFHLPHIRLAIIIKLSLLYIYFTLVRHPQEGTDLYISDRVKDGDGT